MIITQGFVDNTIITRGFGSGLLDLYHEVVSFLVNIYRTVTFEVEG